MKFFCCWDTYLVPVNQTLFALGLQALGLLDMNVQLNSHVKERNYDNLMTFLIRGQYDVNQMSEELEGPTALHLACKASLTLHTRQFYHFAVLVLEKNSLFIINQSTEGPCESCSQYRNGCLDRLAGAGAAHCTYVT